MPPQTIQPPPSVNIDVVDVSTPTGQIAAGGIGISFLVWAFFRIRKMWRDDNGDANLSKRQDEYLNKLETRIQDLQERADKFAQERNEATARASIFEGEVKALKIKIEHIENERNEAKRLLEVLENKYKELHAENDSLKNEISSLRAIVDRRLVSRDNIN